EERRFLAAIVEALRGVGAEQATLLGEAAAGLQAAVVGGGERIDAAAQRLESAAGAVGTSAASLAPAAAALAPELAALAREVALLAGQRDGDDEALVLDEVARLGAGVERLEALLRLAGADAP